MSKSTRRKGWNPKRATTGDDFPPLTRKQYEVLDALRQWRSRYGYCPSLQELADELSVSKVTVHEHVASLEQKGVVIRSPHKARSLEIAEEFVFPEDQQDNGIPMVGSIAAGRPIEAIEDREYVYLDMMFDQRESLFVLRVQGDSMIDDHICDGDMVICKRTTRADNGQVVVAVTDDGEATLKRLYRDGKRIRLQPANEAYEPLFVDSVDIQGVVVGLLRQY